MRKSLFFLFFMSLTCLSYSQIGIRAGANMSNVAISSQSTTILPDAKIGFHFGVNFEADLGTNLTLRPGIIYSIQGFKIAGFDSQSLNYINIPVNVVYNFGEQEKGFFLQGGPYLGLVMSAKSGEEDFKDDLNSIDFGFGLGAGYNINSNMSVGLDYALGLSNIEKDPPTGQTIKNINFMLYFLYRI